MTVSKELFEAVIQEKVEVFEVRELLYNDIIYFDGDSINIDTFFFKCIDWLYDKRYKIRMTNFSFEIHTLKPWKPMTSLLCRRTADVNKNNTDALKGLCFDACQWILENKDV